MPRVLKRRAEAEASPSPPPQRRRSNSAFAEVAFDDDAAGVHSSDAGGTHEQMVKKLVRLALATEYNRQPLRRSDISTKVLHPQGRAFAAVFKVAKDVLEQTFGMTLTELPSKEKNTIAQKRAAQRAGNSLASQSQNSSKSYILTSTLPPNMRRLPILAPPKIPSIDTEAAYTGLYSFVVAVIMLSVGQRISDGKLLKHLSKVSADDIIMEEKTEKLLKRMEREGYVIKIKEREGVGGEETIDWVVGPRGKVEVGERGVASLVKNAYGKVGTDIEELEEKLEKSLGKGTFKRRTQSLEDPLNGEANGQEAERTQAEEEEEAPQTNGTRAVQYRGTARPNGTNGVPVRQHTRAQPRMAPQEPPRRASRRGSGIVDDTAEVDGDEDEDEDESEDESESDG